MEYKFSHINISSNESDRSEQIERIVSGLASTEEAYSVGMNMLGCAGDSIQHFFNRDLDNASREEVSDFLDHLEKERKIALSAVTMFEHYPAVKFAAKGLYDSLNLAYSTVVGCIYPAGRNRKYKAEKTTTYLIKNPVSGLIKIGRTIDIKSRISTLQCGAGIPLEVLATIDGDVERKLHIKFARYRKHGEWFEDVDGDISSYGYMIGSAA